ncbi:MAG TPA: YiiD C-terminal domain-containing protein [Thermoanaerobaculia bacterium]|nr:YiiD C-terminal domain-containing protein [Thermoanaerobaculia bacterium]
MTLEEATHDGPYLAMDIAVVQRYLHDHIPLSKAMEVEVLEATESGVKLAAPLAPNINHRETVFGGSASAVAILSAWTLIYLRLQSVRINARIVIQRNTMSYERPITGAFSASAAIPEAAWRRFAEALRRKSRGRVAVNSVLCCAAEKVATFEGDFVAWIL